MENQPSPEAIAEIRKIADRIAVANQLDPEIRAELVTHMEDKLRAYLDGELRPTEADALLLTQAHFGETSSVQALLRRVHALDFSISLARRLAAVASATLAATLMSTLLRFPIPFALRYIVRRTGGVPESPSSIDFTSNAIAALLPAALLLGIVVYWKRRLDRRETPWFQSAPPWVLAIVLSTLAFATLAASPVLTRLNFYLSTFAFGQIHVQQAVFVPSPLSYMLMCGSLLAGVTVPLLWLWWCDRAPRSQAAMIVVALAWLAYQAVFGLGGYYVTYLFMPVQFLLIPGYWARVLASYGVQTVLVTALLLLAYLIITRSRRNGNCSPA